MSAALSAASARIRHIRLKNLHVEGTFNGASLWGFDEEHRIEDVSVDGIYVHNGGKIEKIIGEIPYRDLKFADPIRMEK